VFEDPSRVDVYVAEAGRAPTRRVYSSGGAGAFSVAWTGPDDLAISSHAADVSLACRYGGDAIGAGQLAITYQLASRPKTSGCGG
jgi:hypothetical protein